MTKSLRRSKKLFKRKKTMGLDCLVLGVANISFASQNTLLYNDEAFRSFFFYVQALLVLIEM